MLKLTLKRGDAVHQTPEDHNAAMATGSNSALRI